MFILAQPTSTLSHAGIPASEVTIVSHSVEDPKFHLEKTTTPQRRTQRVHSERRESQWLVDSERARRSKDQKFE
jgi:hypothetical protein